MNTKYTSMLCAALALPALVQPAVAQEEASLAEEFITTLIELQSAFADVAEAVADENITTKEAAKAINKLSAAINEMMAALPQMSEEDQAAIGDLLQNPELVEALEEMEEGTKLVLQGLKEMDYLNCEELQAACEAYAQAVDIEV